MVGTIPNNGGLRQYRLLKRRICANINGAPSPDQGNNTRGALAPMQTSFSEPQLSGCLLPARHLMDESLDQAEDEFPGVKTTSGSMQL